jgi:hypothetical protein
MLFFDDGVFETYIVLNNRDVSIKNEKKTFGKGLCPKIHCM